LVSSARPASGLRRRVLIVDDEAPIRVAIRRYLERRGWEVEEAKDGREAVDLLGLAGGDAATRTARYDAIVTDLRMPGVSGIEIHDRLAAAAPEALAKLVVISGDTASLEVSEFLARLRRPVVQKPFDMRALADLLDRTAPPTPAASS
jgi:CheY-like chemotaxis protein